MPATDELAQFVILAPPGAQIPGASANVSRDRTERARLLSEMQRLRGRVALRENAIQAAMLDSSGRHVMACDEKSWHLLSLRENGKIAGCARLLVHPRNVEFQELRIATSSVARCSPWSRHVRSAVESELTRARMNGMTTIEPGGWVVGEDNRGTGGAVSIAIGAFAWAQILGQCHGFLTATVKHGSSSILRRLGGRRLQTGDRTIPGYFEPAWGCNVELLRFDTNSLNPRFGAALASARNRVLHAPVFPADAPAEIPPKLRLHTPEIRWTARVRTAA